jgi:HAD superfamily hydrolase (TIGR01509 family)
MTEQKDIREVFFDWDGTFADTEVISLALTRRVLSDYAASVFNQPMDKQLDSIEMRGKDFGQIARLFQDAVNAELPDDKKIVIDIEDLRHNKLRPAAREALLGARLSPGIGEAVAELQDDMGLGLAVVSNSPRMRIQPLLDKHAFDVRIPKGRLFSAFEDAAGKLKEDPAIYLIAAKALGITPEEAAAVEDSVTGMRAAKGAGIGLRIGYTGLVEPGNVEQVRQALLREGAHAVIDDMKQLPAVIKAYGHSRKSGPL